MVVEEKVEANVYRCAMRRQLEDIGSEEEEEEEEEEQEEEEEKEIEARLFYVGRVLVLDDPPYRRGRGDLLLLRRRGPRQRGGLARSQGLTLVQFPAQRKHLS